MSDRTKRAARLSMLTALGAVLVFLTGVVPAGRLGLMVLASFPVCAALMLYGPGWALGVFAVTAALGFMLFPGAAVIGYAAFFGYYPVAKSLLERLRSRALAWTLKFVLYGLAFAACWTMAKVLFGDVSALPWYLVLLAGAAAFGVYDVCYSLVIQFYIEKIARYIS